MTRPDKHAARFGDRYQPPIDWRRFRDGLQKAQPAIHRITEAIRRYHEAQLVADDAMLSRVWIAPIGCAAPTLAELEAGAPIWVSAGTHTGDDIGWSEAAVTATRLRSPDILNRIDADLLSYDSQHADGDQPWPYGSF